MAEEHTNRRLAAILAADVVGYCRMMASDEVGTLAALKRHREVIFDPAVDEYSGRIVKLIGDGTLVEFASVVDAVKCAVAMQRAVAWPSATCRPQIKLRIGVNLGDVIIDGDDIYGDGVNVAARLEALAEPGGICVASIVNESVGNRDRYRLQGWRRGRASRTSIARSEFGNGTRTATPVTGRPRAEAAAGNRRGVSRPRSPCCRSTTCRAILSRSISPTASPKTSSPICRRSAG